jgi:hypothetical protein
MNKLTTFDKMVLGLIRYTPEEFEEAKRADGRRDWKRINTRAFIVEGKATLLKMAENGDRRPVLGDDSLCSYPNNFDFTMHELAIILIRATSEASGYWDEDGRNYENDDHWTER